MIFHVSMPGSMNGKEEKRVGFKKPEWLDFRGKSSLLVTRFKELQGDPHYVALGMAIGVFVAITPTIPFHTALAVILAFILRGSKPAAVIGVWFSNPVTIPIFYWASYKVGILMLEDCSTDFCQVMSLLETLERRDLPFAAKWQNMAGFFECQVDVLFAMIAGGAVLGIVPGVAVYFITHRIVNRIHSPKQERQDP